MRCPKCRAEMEVTTKATIAGADANTATCANCVFRMPARLLVQWSKDLPTEPGFYWNRTPDKEPTVEYVDWFTEHYCDGDQPLSRQSLHVFYGHSEYETVSSWGGEWAGPLTPPEGD